MSRLLYVLEKPRQIIPVDKFDTPEYPISEEDRIFRHMKGEIILPLHELFLSSQDIEVDERRIQQIDYFIMSNKRSYNSDVNRDHICRYLNYFEKFYDTDHELLMIMYKIKIAIDYIRTYNEDNFMQDVDTYIIRNFELTRKVRRFVEDNYNMHLSSNNNKTPHLQYCDRHAKVLYEISLLMNMYIPLISHFMYIHFIKTSPEIQRVMLKLFDLCVIKYEQERDIHIYDKLYETAISVTNKSISTDKVIWSKNLIRANNPTTHIRDSVIDIIMNIIVKYIYDENIINFNYYSNRKALKYKVNELQYEFSFSRLSNSVRDNENNSAIDKFESKLSKKDEAISLQNKVASEDAVKRIIEMYGPIEDEEVKFYSERLRIDNTPLINSLQFQLIGYLFYKYFDCSQTFLNITANEYIKLIICAKRILMSAGMVILPYIISGRAIRNASRKMINKKDMSRFEASPLYANVRVKYNNDEYVLHKIWELISDVISSQFEIIDYDITTHSPGRYDKLLVPMVDDLVSEELLFFITAI